MSTCVRHGLLWRSAALLTFAALIPSAAMAPGRPTCLVVSDDYVLAGDEKWQRVTVTSTGRLRTGFNTLRITGKDGLTCEGLIEVGGRIELVGGGVVSLEGEVRLLLPTSRVVLEESCELVGDGWIEGRSESAAILIPPGLTLTNRATICGILSIQRTPFGPGQTAALQNYGVVQADRSGILMLDLNVVLSDNGDDTCAAPHWRVTRSPSTLEFRSPTTDLQGTFLIDAGELRCTADVATTGYVRLLNGGAYTGNFSSAGSCIP